MEDALLLRMLTTGRCQPAIASSTLQLASDRYMRTRCPWCLESTIELEALIQTGKCWLSKRSFFIPATSTRAIPMTLHCSSLLSLSTWTSGLLLAFRIRGQITPDKMDGCTVGV